MNRLDHTLSALRRAGRSGLAAYFAAGDPDPEASLALLRGLPAAGADVIELGMPFSDPVADGPILQQANARALAGGQTLKRTLALVRALRETESRTPVVLMGYLNPILRHGVAAFARDAGEAGVDGLILVDLPLEHAGEIDRQLREHGMHLIRMSAPTSEDARLADTLRDAGGFVYHIMLAGTTGAELPDEDRIAQALAKVRAHTGLPVAAGFGVRTPAQARVVGRHADLVAVGTRLAEVLAERGVSGALEEVRLLAGALRQ
ncbi:tryptophan synthase subunit alpha [Achromobacter sp. Marseille-Q0513]|uniref:tryptophan synthase subunit alpha n=1 Tax=Achromobacter sp. Marseille-Q0513 TaxID=2829161 RepID=UPI001BA101C1|nr:tryptophan synthase subunit alpha [Achromobacter sp. Marseille-Q0513]MBR8654690.1 tryptophan synthase subunit alpha [Achromobacter sp. Marseille-Q0513]